MATLARSLPVIVAALLCLLFAALVPSARADIAINTFGPADSYNTSNFNSFGGISATGRIAARFVPPAAATIDRASAAMAYALTGSTTVTLSISIEAAGGGPGSTALWTSNTITVSAAGIYLFTGPSINLAAGQAYWITAYAPSSSSGQTRWYESSPGVAGSVGFGPSPWQVGGVLALPALRVESLPVSGACCSPLTGGCSVLPGPTCTLLGLRFDGGGSTCGVIACHICRGDFNNSGTINAADIFDFLAAWFAGCS